MFGINVIPMASKWQGYLRNGSCSDRVAPGHPLWPEKNLGEQNSWVGKDRRGYLMLADAMNST